MEQQHNPDQSWMHLHFLSEYMRLMMKQCLENDVPFVKAYVLLEMANLQLTHVHPTIADLVEVTGLPKSTVSRCVGGLMDAGYLSERIDPDNRRHRIFDFCTQEAHQAAIGIGLQQIEKFLGPNGERVIRRLFNEKLLSDPELRRSLDTRTLSQIC